jgi:uncharacterized membrane protein YhaH (DUF805 family)
MLCVKCNSQCEDTDQFCGICGASLHFQKGQQLPKSDVSDPPVTFQRAIELVFKRCFEYRGRSTRSEYWWFALFSLLVGIVAAVTRELGGMVALFGFLLQIGILMPSISLGVRRLHDINRSGFWMLGLLGYFPFFIPGLIFTILLMVWAARRSDEGSNKYGPPGTRI